jgi:hypothetical protein
MKKLKTVKKDQSGLLIEQTVGGEHIAPKVLPNVEIGSHLTVYTFQDGRTQLEWDDEALLRDVRNAILSVESNPAVKKKRKKKGIQNEQN